MNGDAFVAKLDNTGSKLKYFTYLGGSADDTALDLAIDRAGNAYLTGFTDSADFPTHNALFGAVSGTIEPSLQIYPTDAFVAKINPDGSGLVYSTYLGGSANDVGSGIAVDPSGNTYVSGYTDSIDFPIKNAFQSYLNGFEDAFVAKISPNGSTLIYSTYLGGSAIDRGEGIAADSSGFAYITGYTDSANFPIFKAQSPKLNGTGNAISVFDAFVTRIAPNGLGLIYSTYLGGIDNDFGYRITVDAAQNAYVTGAAQSPDFPHRRINFEIGNNGTNALNYDAFITRLNPSGMRTYSILFGGTRDEEGWDVAVDGAGRAFVIGTTASTNFPVVNPSGLFRSFNSGGKDAFVTVFDGDGTNVPYSAYLGGGADDYGYGIALDSESSAYITGLTFSSGFPTSPNPFQSTFHGPSSAFLAKIRLSEPVLRTATSGSNLLLSWPITAADYMLQGATSLDSSATWLPLPEPRVANSNLYTVTLGATNGMNFFRLYRP